MTPHEQARWDWSQRYLFGRNPEHMLAPPTIHLGELRRWRPSPQTHLYVGTHGLPICRIARCACQPGFLGAERIVKGLL